MLASQLLGGSAILSLNAPFSGLRAHMNQSKFGLPAAQGLYNPAYEKDACGVGMITNISGERSHEIVAKGMEILKNLEHRGAAGSDPKAGDGAGILTQLPTRYFQEVVKKEAGFDLPEVGEYGVGQVFMPKDEEEITTIQRLFERYTAEEGQEILGWRRVPTDNTCLSERMLYREPAVFQVFIQRKIDKVEDFERKLYVIRRLVEKAVANSDLVDKSFFYICSLSVNTIVYKGMFLAYQLEQYYLDLQAENFVSAIALVHQRYSTNTFPTWGLAQPFRFIAHNGEINTLRGNINWSRSRETIFAADYFGDDMKKLLPIIVEGGSDSASFDNFFEILVSAGRNLPHSFAMMVPEAWEKGIEDEDVRGFYEYHSALMEPWDGPAAIIFTDGTRIGGGLDRNGLRPIRYVETLDGYLIMASEVGVLPVEIDNIKQKGRLGPGMMLLIDTDEGKVTYNEALKKEISLQQPYKRWVEEQKISLEKLPTPPNVSQPNYGKLRLQQRVFQYTYEELIRLIKPMAEKGEEATYSMGNDVPLAVLSKGNKLLFNYFKQVFAQVTNPAIDPIREELVMSLKCQIGGGYNILDESPVLCRMLEVDHPILTNSELEQFRYIDHSGFRSQVVSTLFNIEEWTLKEALDDLRRRAEAAVDSGCRLLILSDRKGDRDHAPLPSLMAVAAVHHYLIHKGKRGKIGLIVESGEVREVHHFALLLGYGAGAINPYLALESITQMEVSGELPGGLDSQRAQQNYIKAVHKGLKKIFSKMGISTLLSYQGAQIFEAIGLSQELIEECFVGTHSVVGGVGLKELEEEIKRRHHRAHASEARNFLKLLTAGDYAWRSQGEFHGYNPETITLLQRATAGEGNYEIFNQFSELIDKGPYQALRHLIRIDTSSCEAVPLEEVESEEALFKRFVTGAMSIGSISREAHETLAIAMNRLGGKSNSGEGGEDPSRYILEPNGDSRRSAIKQVASGRFGVTSEYLVNADELQIKVAQGAKPGEGGQLPGFKVDEYIGRIRHTIPGVTLISPPPHHDIYSIEDLAQLIFDLKNANHKARINVKLVAETGVGTVAAGVAKARADIVTIAGHDGGTGASPATSIKHAGLPWEIGLAETQQTLVLNNLRSQIRVQVDGQIKTGREVVIAALLGGEEFGFATSALIVLGCIMMRKCHLNTCPVGVATQDKELRAHFKGTPEAVIHFFTFIARQVREIMAQLGVRKFDELIGQTQLLKPIEQIDEEIWKAKNLNFSKLFYKPEAQDGVYNNIARPKHNLDGILDQELILRATPALEEGKNVEFKQEIRNRNRTTGTMLGSEVTRRFGGAGLPDDTIKVNFFGTAGQSFGAFIPQGVSLNLRGDANDYVGKGLSGGKIIIASPEQSRWKASANMIAGNTLLYGATSGEAYFSGLVGERFAVRNSGAIAVAEGCGDHGCEYMTGGVVVILGETGKNFAAGMSGGFAFVYDRHKQFKKRCNQSMVDFEVVTEEQHCNLLKELIENHLKYTGSKRAAFLLENWKKNLSDFVMVIPLEYRKIMAREYLKNKLA